MGLMTTLGLAAASVGLAGGALFGVPAAMSHGTTASTATTASTTTTTGTATTTAPATTTAAGGRLATACDRVPEAIKRTKNLGARTAADARTRGSLAWLQAEADAAQAAGHADLATLLRGRLQVRKDLAALLPDRLTMLEQAEKLCGERGNTGA